MKNEEIAKKLGDLAQLYEQLKALRASQGDEFSTEDEELLSRAELLLEALKNYMYQFGMSIYRTKKEKDFSKNSFMTKMKYEDLTNLTHIVLSFRKMNRVFYNVC